MNLVKPDQMRRHILRESSFGGTPLYTEIISTDILLCIDDVSVPGFYPILKALLFGLKCRVYATCLIRSCSVNSG